MTQPSSDGAPDRAEERGDPNDDILAQLESMRLEYAAGLPRTAAELDVLIGHLGQDLPRARADLLHLVHRLSGTAGTYGQHAISESARALEIQLGQEAPAKVLVPGLAELSAELRLARYPVSMQKEEQPAPKTWLRRVLLFAVDPAVREQLGVDMAAAGVALHVAGTEQDALDLLVCFTPDLVILDSSAGLQRGGGLIERFRQRLPTATAIVFLGEEARLQERVWVASAGASLYLTKPMSGAEILRTTQLFAPGPYAGCSVLIVDDDPQIIGMVRALLSSCGIKIKAASTADQFWATLSAEPPSLMLLDISLPVYDGFDLCRAVKADPRFRDIPIVFLTSRLGAADRTAAFLAGADDYIPKPLSPAEFLARITSRLRWTIEARERARERDLAMRTLREQHGLMEEEQARSERLLLNVLPRSIAARLKWEPSVIADAYPEVTVLFADIVGFTELLGRNSPGEMVAMLNRIFTAFDGLAERHALEKIKTVGDAYMIVGGIPVSMEDHQGAAARMALDMLKEMRACGAGLSLRIGIHSGPVVAGVIGTKKFSYDVWGDTVNIASRMESHGQAGLIQVTEPVYKALQDRFRLEERGLVQIKGKGEMLTYWLREPSDE